MLHFGRKQKYISNEFMYIIYQRVSESIQQGLAKKKTHDDDHLDLY